MGFLAGIFEALLKGKNTSNEEQPISLDSQNRIRIATAPEPHASTHDVGGTDPLTTGPIQEITDSTNVNGTGPGYALEDHQHSHGNRGGGTLHANATGATSGFMSNLDKTKLDGIATGATNTPLTATPPVDVNRTAATVGVSTEAARQDHKHDIAVGVPVDIGTANAQGSASSLALSDHVHDHGNQGGGTLHADAVPGTSGFMSGADKTKLDNLPSIAPGTSWLQSVKTASVQNLNATPTILTFNANTSAGSDISHTPGSAIFTINTTGVYEVKFSLSGENQNGFRKNIIASARVNGVENQTLRCYGYARDLVDEFLTCTQPGFYLSLNATDTIEVGTFGTGSGGACNSILNECWVQITRIS